MMIRVFNDEKIVCQRKYTQDHYEFQNNILFIYYHQLLYLTFVGYMLPHTLLLKNREGVVQGNPTTNMMCTIITIRHIPTVTTSIKCIID